MRGSDQSATRRDYWQSDMLAGGFLFFSGFAWGCFWWSHWAVGAFVQAVAFGLLARMAWESRRAASDQERES
jgi:hypothetical protein